jgi:ubiquinone/menaquinone biosynthesis C-methylase UbiE
MNCDRIARLYRWIEYAAFGNALQRRRTALLDQASGVRRVLALGDGDGRALVALLQAAPAAQVDYVDVSAQMLRLARTRIATNGADRVRFRQADARVMQLEESAYDLIVTHFFLDCFDECDQSLLVDKIARAAVPEARWIVSEFRPANRLAKLLTPVMYSFFGMTAALKTCRLVDHHPHLSRNGFRLARSRQAWAGMIASELWVLDAEE